VDNNRYWVRAAPVVIRWRLAQQAVKELNIEAKIEKVSDQLREKSMKYTMSTPGS